jgi:transcriptional regulator with XRE-family HTH domain
MKLSDLKTSEQLIAELLQTDPDFCGEWRRTTLGRAVAVTIVGYRAHYDLSQRELAERLDMSQAQVTRLELGEVNPSVKTLMRLSSRLGIEFTIDLRPAGTPARNLTKRARREHVVTSVTIDKAELLVAAQ